METPEQLLISALYRIACSQSVETRSDMIDEASQALSAYMKATGLEALDVPKKKEPVN